MHADTQDAWFSSIILPSPQAPGEPITMTQSDPEKQQSRVLSARSSLKSSRRAPPVSLKAGEEIIHASRSKACGRAFINPQVFS